MHVKALRNRAIAYEKLDRLEFAIDDLRDALQAAEDSEDKTVQAALQRDLDRLHDKYEEAQEEYEPDYDDDDDDCYYDDYRDDYDDDEDGFGHPYNCGYHGYTAEKYARFFSETMKRGRAINKVMLVPGCPRLPSARWGMLDFARDVDALPSPRSSTTALWASAREPAKRR